MVITLIVAGLVLSFLFWIFIGREAGGGFGVIWSVWATLYFGIFGAIIYVVAHFITKYW